MKTCFQFVLLCVCIYISLGVRQLGPHWFLTSILLATALVLPALTLDSLLCYYCPLQHRGKSCANITSQCLPDQRCSSSRGRYGSVHILSAQGCVDSELCGSHELLSYRGVKYNVSHTCCCKDKCNGRPNFRTLSHPGSCWLFFFYHVSAITSNTQHLYGSYGSENGWCYSTQLDLFMFSTNERHLDSEHGGRTSYMYSMADQMSQDKTWDTIYKHTITNTREEL
uniref:UPAR/Ly6 domain-containing protein n=1 Tax=Seriola dumerili TaxID=41447 RepID=A0A3B4VI63_SERDU